MIFEILKNKIKLNIFGQEIYRSLIKGFYNNASLAEIIFKLIIYQSYENFEFWFSEVKKFLSRDWTIFS